MARERMVTRTVTSYECVCKVANLDNNTIEDIVVNIPEQNTAKKFDEMVKNECTNESRAFIKLVSKTPIEILYGMPETEFIKYAKIMPTRVKSSEEQA